MNNKTTRCLCLLYYLNLNIREIKFCKHATTTTNYSYLKHWKTKSKLAKTAEEFKVILWAMWELRQENINACSVDSWWQNHWNFPLLVHIFISSSSGDFVPPFRYCQPLRRGTNKKILGPHTFFRGLYPAFWKSGITVKDVLSWFFPVGKYFCVYSTALGNYGNLACSFHVCLL